MVRSLGLVAFAMMTILVASLSGTADVRTPRDAAIARRGQIPPTMPPAPEPPRQRMPEWTQQPPSPFPDPGVRPLWVPDTYLWNGFRQYRVPGHWVW